MSSNPEPQYAHRHILLIEDEAEHRLLVEKVLHLHRYTVTSMRAARNGLTATRLMRPTIVLLDLGLPGGMDGFDYLREKGLDESIADIPVVIISTQRDERARVKALRLGAVDYLNKPFSPMELAARVGNLVAKREKELELKEANAKLALQASTDGLTGLSNRETFEMLWENLVAQVRRYPENPLSLIALDIDHFKSINDTFGHAAGDEALRAVSAVLRESVRASDVVGRVGGEEFAIALVHTAESGAQALAEEIRTAVEALQSPPLPRRVTISLGVVSSQGCDPLEMMLRADEALYAAKESGRNRVVVHRVNKEEVKA